MRKDRRSLKQAEKLLRLISRKIDLAEFHMRANARRLEELEGKTDALRTAIHHSLSPSSVQDAIQAVPNWRRMTNALKASQAEENARLQAARRVFEIELEDALKQRKALSSYFKEQKRSPS